VQERRVGPALTGVARRALALAGVALAVVAVDQLTKHWALDRLSRGDIHLVWTLRLSLERNTGAAFSVGGGRGGIIAILALVVVVLTFRAGWVLERKLSLVAVGLVLGGAIGNLADRAFRDGSGFLGGAVVDFIDLQWWPVFNVADMAVVSGAILLALTALRGEP
jgi:signal peptidase II